MNDDGSTLQMSDSRICKAISNRQRMQFEYHGVPRIVEPQCYGITAANKEHVRCHMIEGGSREEQLFDVAKIKNLKLLNENFTKPGPNYKRDDSVFEFIFCQL